MNNGKENWKWGAVFLLLAIFLITANQAYRSIADQEDYDPPTEWQDGDSYDIEQRKLAAEAASNQENLNQNNNEQKEETINNTENTNNDSKVNLDDI